MELRPWQKEATEFFHKNNNCLMEVSTGCLAGDTLIDLPRDLKKNPKGMKIKDLVGKENFYTYTFNIEKNELDLNKVKKVWSSGFKKVYEIKTDKGKIIKATSNHPFLVNIYEKLNKGIGQGKRPKIIERRYKQVSELKVGDKLCTFNRPWKKWNKDGELIRINYNVNYKKELEHRFIMKKLGYKFDEFTIVHHKDKNNLNNSIENLEIMNSIEHNRMHTKERGLFGKDIWPNGEHPKGMKNKNHSDISKKYISINTSKALNKIDFNNYRTKSLYKEYGDNIMKSVLFTSDKIKEGLSRVDKNYLIEKNKKNFNVSYSEKIISIKELGIEEVFDMEVEKNHNFIANGMIVHNSGKTFLAINLIKEVLKENSNLRVLVICPKNVISEKTWIPELHHLGFPINKVGLYNEFSKEFSQITLISIQSSKNLLKWGMYDLFDMVIFDEVHNYGTNNYLDILKIPKKYKIGLSATLKREDLNHYRIYDCFNHNIFKYNIKDALNDKVLNPFDFYNVKLSLDEFNKEQYDDLTTKIYNLLRMKNNGIWNREMDLNLKKLLNQRKQLIYNYPLKFSAVKEIIVKHKDSKILVFNQYNKTSKNLYWELFDLGIKPEIINSDISKDEQTKVFQRFENDESNILLATTMLDEGYNLPKIDVAILMSSNSTEKQFYQRMGRVLRKKDINSKVYYFNVESTFEEDNLNKKLDMIKDISNNYNEVYIEE